LQTDNTFSIKYADPDSPDAFRCFPRLPEDSYIDWKLPVLEIHNLIRASCSPFQGAYTFYKQDKSIKKLFVLKSHIIQSTTPDLAMPGQILSLDKDNGEAWVKCGDGVIALSRCKHDSETENFFPGQTWRSIRMRLGIRSEDWLWAIYTQTTLK